MVKRKKRMNLKRLPPIDVDLDNPDQKRVWDHYQAMTELGEGAKWIRESLIDALPFVSETIAEARARNIKTSAEMTRLKEIHDRGGNVRYESPEDIA